MELKRGLDFKKFYIIFSVSFLFVYLVIGLQPAADAKLLPVYTNINIPSIKLESDVTELKLEGPGLSTPDYIVGSFSKEKNKTLLIGHSSTVFKNLFFVKMNDVILFNGKSYIVNEIKIDAKDDIDMDSLLSEEEIDSLVLMTCAGDSLGSGDYTHRLIIKASLA